MKYLLLPLIAALALPIAINAESYWLIITFGLGGTGAAALEKIEMPSAELCEKEGIFWENSPTHGIHSKNRRFNSIVAKQ